MKRSLAMMLALIMVCALPGIASANGKGSINGACITQNAVSIELEDIKFEKSVKVELFSDKTLLTTATLNEGFVDANQLQKYVTCCIPTKGADEAWSLTPWIPRDNVVPNKAVLFVDDQEMKTMTFTLDAEKWADLPGTVPYSGSINGAGITKDAVFIELEDITFEKSVQVKLFSDETLLTTATLNEGFVDANQLQKYVTCCIPTKGADEAWSLTPWIPRDKIVPNKAVLFVDDHEMDTESFTLNAKEWADLPGTVPYSGSIERAAITHDNGVLKNAVSVDLKNVTFKTSVQVKLYSGDTLLTTATLQGVNPGSYGFLTCCIATETADEYWALTPWTPKDDVVPNKAVLVVDGHEEASKNFTLNADEWAALPGTAFPYSGSIERAVITHKKGDLKNAVSVDLKNVNFETSVQVKLYSGETLLTTATLQGVNPGRHDFLTCFIATENADEYWAVNPLTPKDDVVPDKAVLVVDGHKLDEKTFTLDAEDWAALPGTVLPYSGSTTGGESHWHPPVTPAPVPVVVIPPKTGDMTIWQSILHFFGVI